MILYSNLELGPCGKWNLIIGVLQRKH